MSQQETVIDVEKILGGIAKESNQIMKVLLNKDNLIEQLFAELKKVNEELNALKDQSVSDKPVV